MSNAKTGSEDGLPRIIHEQLERLLGPHPVISVMVDEDAFGDEDIGVFVVFDPDKDIPEKFELVEELQPVLASYGEERFPILSFLTPEDAEDYCSRLT